MQALARAAGLERALTLFPDDLALAAETVEKQRGSLVQPTDVAVEPWPAMRTPA